MRSHLPEEELHAFCDGELSSAQRAEIGEHLIGCAECRVVHLEVLALRARSVELLALAIPRSINASRPMPASWQVGEGRMKRGIMSRGSLMAAGLATLLAGGYYITALTTTHAPLPHFAQAFIGSGLLERINPSTAVSSEGARAAFADRMLAIGSHPGNRNQLMVSYSPEPVATATPLEIIDPIDTDLDATWHKVPVDSALGAAKGALPQLDELQLGSIRIRPSSMGARPLFLVRYLRTDGRSVWLAEGAEEELSDVMSLLQTSGLTLSLTRRTHPDYVSIGDSTRRTVRMVALAAYLPPDTLNALVAKVKLK